MERVDASQNKWSCFSFRVSEKQKHRSIRKWDFYLSFEETKDMKVKKWNFTQPLWPNPIQSPLVQVNHFFEKSVWRVDKFECMWFQNVIFFLLLILSVEQETPSSKGKQAALGRIAALCLGRIKPVPAWLRAEKICSDTAEKHFSFSR